MASTSKAARVRRRLERTAYHEAGHAVAAFELHRAIRHVTIVPSDDSLGHILKTLPSAAIRPDIPGENRSLQWCEREVMICLAGGEAEAIFIGRRNHIGASSDYKSAVYFGSYLYCDEVVLGKWLDFMMERTRVFLRPPHRWMQVEALAKALLVHRELGARRAREICLAAMRDRARFREPCRAGSDEAASDVTA